MEQIKSALEIALEKTAHVKRASDEEIRRHKEKELTSLAIGIVQKYLRGESKLRDLASASERYAEKGLMSQAIWQQLVAAVDLDSYDSALEGLEFLAEDEEAVKKVTEEVRTIDHELCLEKSNIQRILSDKIGESVKNELALLGISGSSIDIDVESTAQWQQYLHELEARFQAKIELAKERLGRLAPNKQ
jgi:hypothetical protein